jgi:hypothetical protein
MSESVGAAARITSITAPMRSLTMRELRALSRSCRSASDSSTTSLVPDPLGDGAVVLVAAQQQVPEGAQDAALRLEGDVQRLQCDPASAAIAAIVVAA